MNIFYSKKEYDEMVKRYNKKIKSLESQVAKLEKRIEKYKEDYNILLETATEA